LNLYRGCIHNCVYCDGRYEKYQVDGMKKELDPKRKRKPMKKGFIGLGGVLVIVIKVIMGCNITQYWNLNPEIS